MNFQELASYLVKLGFVVDQPALRKFEEAMGKAGGIVDKHTGGIVGNMLKWQGAVIGAFTTVGIATLGLMDKVAMADQNYRLFARDMFMAEGPARRMKIAMDALGESLDHIAWDPELLGRYEMIVAAQERMERSARTPQVETGLRGIRDVRAQFTLLGVELQTIATVTAGKLFHSLGGENVLARLERLNDWVQTHLPQITDWIVKYFTPIMRDFGRVMEDVWKVIKALGSAFEHLLGTDQINDKRDSFERFGDALDKFADDLVRFVDAMTSAELVTIDLLNALLDLAHFDFKALGGDLKKAGHDLTPGGAVVGGIGIAGTLLGASSMWGLAKIIGSIARAGAGGVATGAGQAATASGVTAATVAAPLAITAGVGAGLYFGAKEFDEHWGTALRKKMGLTDDASENFSRVFGIPRAASAGGPTGSIDDAAKKYGVDPNLAHAVAHQESGERQFDSQGQVIVSGAHARGMFQLEPSTAKGLGVDPDDTAQNIDGGVRLISRLLKKYGDMDKALAAYNWGEGHLDSAIKQHGGFSESYLPAETRQYIHSIEGKMAPAPGVQVGEVHTHVHVSQPNASPAQIAAAAEHGTRRALERQTQYGIANLQGAYG